MLRINPKALKKLTLLLRFLILSRCRSKEESEKLLAILNEFEDACHEK